MNKMVIAITGASGSIYAKLVINKLLAAGSQVDAIGLLMSENAKTVWQHELGNDDFDNYGQNSKISFYHSKDFNAPFASGSGQYNSMIVVPCSMGTLGRIAHGISDDLLTRAADVVLKERRKLILVAREMPYSLIHIRNMEMVTLAGGIICPATPSFYSLPSSMEEVAATVADRVLDLAGIRHPSYRWGANDE